MSKQLSSAQQTKLNNNQKPNIGDSVIMKKIQSSISTLALALVVGVSSLTTDCRAAGNIGDIFQIGQITFAGGKRDFVSTPFVRPVEENGTGIVSAVSDSTTLVLNPDGDDYSGTGQWTGGSATSADKWYIVEILDGRYIGLVFLIATQNGNTVTTTEVALPTDGALVGSKYAIRKDWTLATLFGDTSSPSFPLAKNTSASTADTINVFVQKTQGFVTYYVNTSGLWKNGFNQTTPHARVPYGAGIQVLRRASGDATMTLSGEARKSRLRRDVGVNEFALIANLSLAPTTLQTLAPSIDRGASAAEDKVEVWSTATALGSWVPYFRRNSDGAFTSAFGTTLNVPVAAGKVVRVRNTGVARTGANAITAEPNLP
jgi:hypothetical protein